MQRGDIIVEKIASEDNLADPFTKALKTKVFDSCIQHRSQMYSQGFGFHGL